MTINSNRELRSDRDAELNEYARRIAAAYVSVWAGYSGVDYLLKRTPETADNFWYAVAEAVHKAFRERRRTRTVGKYFKAEWK